MQATELAKLGSMREAVEVLTAGCRLVERFTPEMCKDLSGMAVFSRMSAAMSTVPSLHPEHFRVPTTVYLVRLNKVVHHFLVTATERFRLRVYILGRGFSVTTRLLQDSCERIRRQEDAWPLVETARHDLRSLSERTLESFRLLLIALSAQPQRAAAILPKGWEV
jgi:hypothetical protein